MCCPPQLSASMEMVPIRVLHFNPMSGLRLTTASLVFLRTITFCITVSQSQTNPSSPYGPCADRPYYYNACAPSTCGNATISFPFSSSEPVCHLPGYEVQCDGTDSPSPTPTINLQGRSYAIRAIHQEECILVVADTELVNSMLSGECDVVQGHSLPISWGHNITILSSESNRSFLTCPQGSALPPQLAAGALAVSGCKGNNTLYYTTNMTIEYAAMDPRPCRRAALPIQLIYLNSELKNPNTTTVAAIFKDGLALRWENRTECRSYEADGGRCGYNHTTNTSLCFCDGRCSQGGQPESKSISWKIPVATVVPSVSIVLVVLVSLLKFRQKATSIITKYYGKKISRRGVDVQEFIKNYRLMLPTQYTYAEIKKMTGGFKDKLGEGGFGSVYRGKLPNGSPMATKILEKSSDSGQDFVNEVATIGRIHHVNIIRLMGFCCDHSHRALVYEFMPNGSLEDLLSKEEARQQMGIANMLKISIGIARGIEYLHHGCDTRILHLDIKPQNVLLDQDFHPKISDFGLAKLCSRKASAVQLTGARGTAGYIAPEVFLRNFGGVSNKSDVYSFGMLLLDMVLEKKQTVMEDSNSSSKMYFPDCIYDRIYQDRETEVGDHAVVEEDISRMMIMVGLWCIQTKPADRPSISQVLEMLTGRVEDIELPPKPVLFSPPREFQEQESTPMNSNRDSLESTSERKWKMKISFQDMMSRH